MLTVGGKLQPVTQLNERAISLNCNHQFTLKSLGDYLLSSHPLQLEKDVSFQNNQVFDVHAKLRFRLSLVALNLILHG